MLSMRHSSPFDRSIVPLFALCFVFFCTFSSFASAQLVKGQFFTRGLAISDSPAPQSQTNAGGNLNVAVDLSGDGKLPQDAFLPTSTSQTAYQSLNIYLVSAETNVNLTVTEGPQFLEQEPGSTVKHLTWPIPACVPSGNYNLTYYELSRIQGPSYYSITPIPIVIKSQSTSPCFNVSAPSLQPQSSSPPPQQPWLAPGSPITSPTFPAPSPGSPSATVSGSLTTVSGILTTIVNPSDTGVTTITLSPSPTTVTFVSTMTIPTTISGSATVFITLTTRASVSTVLPTSTGGAFLPVNGAISTSLGSPGCLPFVIFWIYVGAVSFI